MSDAEAILARRCVLVCQHQSCTRSGAAEVLKAFQDAVDESLLVSASDCMGQCAVGVSVRVLPDDSWYCRIRPHHVAAIVEQHLWANQPVSELLHPRFHPQQAYLP
jgi:(2Fe-2S) ferredoxin